MLKASRSTTKSQVVRRIKREGHATRRSDFRSSNAPSTHFFRVERVVLTQVLTENEGVPRLQKCL